MRWPSIFTRFRAGRSQARGRVIAPEALNLSPALVGQPLAAPRRRLAAMAVDLLLLALLSAVDGPWLLIGLLLVVLQLRSEVAASARARQWVGWLGAALMALLIAQQALHRLASSPTPTPPPPTPLAEAGPATRAHPTAPRRVTAPGLTLTTAEQRIRELEAELEAARHPPGWRQQLDRLIEAAGLSFGWGIVYFSLLPAWWGGQTVGKKLLRLRVVELTGQPMTVLHCLKRYGGYAAGMATGGLGFVQVLWDPNHQGLQDKAAHTAVIDLRQPRSAPLQQGQDLGREPRPD